MSDTCKSCGAAYFNGEDACGYCKTPRGAFVAKWSTGIAKDTSQQFATYRRIEPSASRVAGSVIGAYFGASSLGYALGAWKIAALMILPALCIAVGLHLAGVEIPAPPKPPVCAHYEVQTRHAFIGRMWVPLTGPVCIQWEKQ